MLTESASPFFIKMTFFISTLKVWPTFKFQPLYIAPKPHKIRGLSEVLFGQR